MRPETVAAWMRQRVNEARAEGLVVGLSGGIDSAVVARLCQLAAPGHALGVILPCHSSPDDERDARLLADHFKLPSVRIPLDEPFDALTRLAATAATSAAAVLGQPEPTPDDIRARMPLANVKPRLRMASCYFVANRFNYLVAGTGNRCELAIGYFTKYGDGGVDLLPLGNLLKSEVREMARALGVPQSIIDKPPSAGLWMGQTDEGEMGFTYAELEDYLEKGQGAVNPAVGLRIERLMRASEHKRRMAPMPEL
ncbi:MAG: NAD(+) synthase [Bacteroidales bacterium]